MRKSSSYFNALVSFWSSGPKFSSISPLVKFDLGKNRRTLCLSLRSNYTYQEKLDEQKHFGTLCL